MVIFAKEHMKKIIKDFNLKPMKILKNNEFMCDDCGGVFEKEWSEKKALKEKKDNGWGDMDMNSMAEVCDSCYNKIMNSMN